MKRLFPLLLFVAFAIATGCSKSEEAADADNSTVAAAVKTGDWMVIYTENNTAVDVGLTMIKFNSNGSLTVNKDGTNHNGTWAESKTGSNHTLMMNLTTTDATLQKVNRTWKVTNVSASWIDLADGNAAVGLMKH